MRDPSPGFSVSQMKLYLVERYVAGPPEERLDGIARRLRKAATELTAGGVEVRYLQSILLTGEESCLCLFEAPSESEVRMVNERAGLPYLRIVAATSASGQTRAAITRADRRRPPAAGPRPA